MKRGYGYLLIIFLLYSCFLEKKPIKIGFIGGLSGANADMGEVGRNGAMIAISDINKQGGIKGAPVELLIRDDRNEPETARQAARDLINQNVSTIIGPFTSTLTVAAMQEAAPEEMLVFSPTASADNLDGMDDNLIRLVRSAGTNAALYADFMYKTRGFRRTALFIDQQNHVYSNSWRQIFTRQFLSLGGSVVIDIPYNLTENKNVGDIVKKALIADPDSILMISNSVDVARISQQIRKYNPLIPLLASDWAGTSQLIEMGGPAVEGLELMLQFDKQGTQQPFLDFLTQYREIFNCEPSFNSYLAYESVMIVLTAIKQKSPRESMKEAILKYGPYEGLQTTITIDGFGDIQREALFAVIKDRQFEKLPR